MRGDLTLPLTDEEREAVEMVAIQLAIKEAEREKAVRFFKEVYQKYTMGEKYFPQLTAKEFKEMIIALGNARAEDKKWRKPFTITAENEPIIDALSLYFTNDIRFESLKDGYSLDKGILLIGDVGCGKTVLLELCHRNQKQCYTKHSCLEIVSEYSSVDKQSGQEVIKEYSSNMKSTNKNQTLGQEELGRFFDDLGTENIGKHFGNTTNVMDVIIQNRYNKGFDFPKTLITSNLVMDEIYQAYGKRSHSRLHAMLNIIEFPPTAKDWRI